MGHRIIYMAMTLALTYSPMAQGQCISDNDEVAAGEQVTPDLSGITDFGLELFKEIFPHNATKNFFFSPYSIWNALTLAYFGSEGQTMQQLQQVLRTSDKASAMKQFRHLQNTYEKRQVNHSDYTFNLASKAYFDETVNLRTCLKDVMSKEIEILNFGQSEASAKIINDFVSNVTKGRITQIVNPGDIRDSRMALVNAAFFKGTWLYQFEPSATEKKTFYITKDDQYLVEMMSQEGSFRNGPSEELGAHVLELPYTGEDISMIILLPPFIAGEEGFNNMVEKINGPILQKAIDSLEMGQVEVSIPKFKLEETIGDELIPALSYMGIIDLFDITLANLTSFDSEGGLSVGKTIHKAFVEVNEEGTEAAAATALIDFRASRPIEPKKFICTHPFVFAIFDNVTKNILFLGAYKNPKVLDGTS